MKRVVAKFVPWLLLPEHRAAVADDLIQTATHEPEVLKKIITLKGTEASLSYVQYFLYLVFSSISVSIFHSTWLDTFCTEFFFIHKFFHYQLSPLYVRAIALYFQHSITENLRRFDFFSLS